jgi:hypothetical protein
MDTAIPLLILTALLPVFVPSRSVTSVGCTMILHGIKPDY